MKYGLTAWYYTKYTMFGFSQNMFWFKLSLLRFIFMLCALSFFGPLAVARRVLWIGSVRTSIFLSILQSVLLSGYLLGIVSLVFSKFWPGARNSWSCAWHSWIFQKENVCPKIGKMDQKWNKNVVFWIYWKKLSLISTEFVL